MKHSLLALFLAAGVANAAPTLTADPYPSTGVQPDAATVSVNGTQTIQCTLKTVTGGLQPSCDLVSITAPGTYTLVMTVTKNAGCVGNTCSGGGSASSAPFTYIWQGVNVTRPVVRLEP
jgi:hypothetical protein